MSGRPPETPLSEILPMVTGMRGPFEKAVEGLFGPGSFQLQGPVRGLQSVLRDRVSTRWVGARWALEPLNNMEGRGSEDQRLRTGTCT